MKQDSLLRTMVLRLAITVSLFPVLPIYAQQSHQPPLKVAANEKHPEIRAAMRHLNQARDNLQKGAHDFSGHREQALDLVDKALEQCRLALQSDNQ